jgi:hypothetical protein
VTLYIFNVFYILLKGSVYDVHNDPSSYCTLSAIPGAWPWPLGCPTCWPPTIRTKGKKQGQKYSMFLSSKNFKGIVSRKFDMLLLVPLDRYKFSTAFLLYPFFKISSLSCRIFYYKMFSGGFFYNVVNEFCTSH